MSRRNFKFRAIFIIIGMYMIIMPIFNNFSLANSGEYDTTFVAKSGLNNIQNYIEQEIIKDGETYNFETFKEEKIENEKIKKELTTNTKELTSNNKEFLNEQFENIIDYEDDEYIGKLQLVDFNIETINNGFNERIDSKEIVFPNLKTNDLWQIEKRRIINEREYILNHVIWETKENQEIDNTLVPILYNGNAIYQCLIRTYNPDTYKVSANYAGNIEKKEQFSNYIVTYKMKEDNEVEQDENFIIPALIILVGFFASGTIAFLLRPNAIIYNIQNKTDLVKIKRVRITKGKIIDITSNQDRILGNSFILQLSNSAFNKLSNSTVAIKFNSQKKDVMVTSIKNYFSF